MQVQNFKLGSWSHSRGRTTNFFYERLRHSSKGVSEVLQKSCIKMINDFNWNFKLYAYNTLSYICIYKSFLNFIIFILHMKNMLEKLDLDSTGYLFKIVVFFFEVLLHKQSSCLILYYITLKCQYGTKNFMISFLFLHLNAFSQWWISYFQTMHNSCKLKHCLLITSCRQEKKKIVGSFIFAHIIVV